jgi:hypothetical protein
VSLVDSIPGASFLCQVDRVSLYLMTTDVDVELDGDRYLIACNSILVGGGHGEFPMTIVDDPSSALNWVLWAMSGDSDEGCVSVDFRVRRVGWTCEDYEKCIHWIRGIQLQESCIASWSIDECIAAVVSSALRALAVVGWIHPCIDRGGAGSRSLCLEHRMSIPLVYQGVLPRVLGLHAPEPGGGGV